MGCFDNFIGIDNCGSENPTSGKYLIDGGITLRELNLFAGQDFTDGVALGESKINNSINLVTNDIHNHFGSKYKTKTLLDSQRVGYFNENMTVKSGANEYRGIRLKNYNESSFLAINIHSIDLFIDYSGSVDILIYDVTQNKLLDTIEATTVADVINNITVNKTYYSDKKHFDIAIVYQSSGINSYATTISSSGCTSCNATSLYPVNGYIKAVSVRSSGTFLANTLESMSHMSGVSVNYSIECDFNKFICLHANRLAIPIIYKASSEVMTYAMYNSERVNYETINVDQLKERRDFYEMQYREQMDTILKNIEVPNDKTCFLCTQKLNTRLLMP